MDSPKEDLTDLEWEFSQFDENTPTKDLHDFVERVRIASSNCDATDRQRIELQLDALREIWRRDGLTGQIAWSIIFSDDASLSQKIRAFTTWLGLGKP